MVEQEKLERLAHLKFREEEFGIKIHEAEELEQSLIASDPENKAYLAEFLPQLIEQLREHARKEAEERTKIKKAEAKAAKELKDAEEARKAKAEALDLTHIAIEAFRSATPLSILRELIRAMGASWSGDEHTDRKAFIFACFSELAYLKHSKYDLPGRDRYKIVPSVALESLKAHNIEIDLAGVVGVVGEFETTVIDPGRGFLYVTFRTADFIVIAVRGTVPRSTDWFIDANFLKKSIGKEKYHRGFYKEASLALPAIQGAVGTTPVPIYLTGHSMGGAVAMVLRNIWGLTHKLMTPYVYASPRIGNEEVVKNTPAYSYVRSGDIIPHVPPIMFGYGKAKTFLIDDEMGKSGLAKLKDWLLPIQHHWIEGYRKELGKRTQAPDFSTSIYFDSLRAEMVSVYKKWSEPLPYGLAEKN